MFPKIVVPPKSSHFNRVFHYNPSILGYPLFLETPTSNLSRSHFWIGKIPFSKPTFVRFQPFVLPSGLSFVCPPKKKQRREKKRCWNAMNSVVMLYFHHFFPQKRKKTSVSPTYIGTNHPWRSYWYLWVSVWPEAQTPTPWGENKFSCQICHRIHVWYIYLHLKPNWPLFWLEFVPSFEGFFSPKIEDTGSRRFWW